MSAAQATRGREARILAWAGAALTAVAFALLVLGALVRAHGAGLACPDWPLCFGQWVPAFDLRVAFEYGHRALAGSVSIGFALLSLALVRRAALRSRTAALLGVGWALLAVQIALGGLTVWLRLAPWTVTAHLLTGTSFCTVLLWITRALFELRSGVAREPLPRRLQIGVAASATLLVAQLALGGLVSSQGAGLACAQFPTCDGSAWVPTLQGLTGLHVLHRLNAVLLLCSFAVLVALSRQRARLAALAWTGLRLVLVQIALGAVNVLAQLPVEVTALHSAVAAAIALTTALLVREVVLCGVAASPVAAAAPAAVP